MKDSVLTPISMFRPRPSIPMCQLMGLMRQVPIKHRNECGVCVTEETTFLWKSYDILVPSRGNADSPINHYHRPMYLLYTYRPQVLHSIIWSCQTRGSNHIPDRLGSRKGLPGSLKVLAWVTRPTLISFTDVEKRRQIWKRSQEFRCEYLFQKIAREKQVGYVDFSFLEFMK